MPIYEYQCDACDEIFEELILGKQDRPDGCPACGGDQVHRVISQTSFQLKGDGWYVTDFKGSPAPASKKADAGETAATSGDASPTTSSGGSGDASAPSASDTASTTPKSTSDKGAA